MAFRLKVPQMGESVVEGTIGKWFVKEGEDFKKDQPLVEILTDKVNVEVPSEADGVMLEILAPEGEIVPVGKEIAVIGEPGEKATKTAKSAPAPKPQSEIAAPATKAAAPARKAVKAEGPQKLSPAVRRLIKEHGVDVTELAGSGAGGRVTVKDIEAHLASSGVATSSPAAPMQATPTVASQLTGGDKPVEEIPIPRVRGLIAEHMVRSKQISPHVTTFDECDFTSLVEFRRRHVDRIEQETGIRVTYLPFIVAAVCKALKEFPYMNASLTEDKIILRHYYNIGMAVAREDGLIVPVIKDADRKSVLELGAAMKDLGNRARTGKLMPQDIEGGTFSVTNAGGYGAINSTPIISQPQVAILGVHAIQERPVVRDGEIVIRHMMNFGLAFDHRLIDGHYAVQFLRRTITLLEEPAFMLL
jgi:2-oxoglutarate dehydrogenase complex dihydrolipoamide succinyltransferase (E2) component